MYVFVSPHFDDAAGSCGCLISGLKRSGKEIYVVTVFAGETGPALSPFARGFRHMWHMKDPVGERSAENSRACGILGAVPWDLPFQDAIYRKEEDWLYQSSEELFGPVREEDYDLPERIAGMIFMRFGTGAEYYFPLGAGDHVDHVLVRTAGGILGKMGCRVWYYRDFSYEDAKDRDPELREYIIESSLQDLRIKTEAVKCYRSQLEMLFEDGDPEAYFKRVNLSGQGKVFETYYRICSPDRKAFQEDPHAGK